MVASAEYLEQLAKSIAISLTKIGVFNSSAKRCLEIVFFLIAQPRASPFIERNLLITITTQFFFSSAEFN